MTDVLDRAPESTRFDRTEYPAQERIAPARKGRVSARAPFDPSRPLRWALAALSAAGGAIHLVMVPSHWELSVAEGIGFAVAGWFQLGVAWLILTRPSRGLVRVAVLANALLIGTWAWSRLYGLPFGEHANHAESAGFVDLTTVGLEAGFIAVAFLALFHPAIGRRWKGMRLRVAAMVPIAVAALATAAIASPSARDHAGGAHGEHGMAAGAGHHDAAAPVDDKGLSLLGNGHHAAIGPEKPLTPEERAELTSQIAVTQRVGEMYPTRADAEAAGYRRAGPYSPGLGIHYIRPSGEGLNSDGVMSEADLLAPLSIIYAGTEPDAPIAGFMYYSMSEDKPTGFAGPNDVWHYHTNTCVVYAADGIDAPFGADADVPARLCEQAGGQMLETTQWMVHVWSLPGWESQQGLFGEVNPALTCPDGTYYIMPMRQWIDHPLNVCKSEV
jgi:hypothetical protein